MKNLIGVRFGRWVVISYDCPYVPSRHKWTCKCDCGTVSSVRSDHLLNGESLSCGCLTLECISKANKTHGLSTTRAYRIWAGLKNRCKSEGGLDNYGGRGISVCSRWSKFENFLADMGAPPPKLTIERIDNDKGYSKSNCKWDTRLAQSNNKRNNINVSFLGQTKTIAQWSRIAGIGKDTLGNRLKSGWSVERALLIPTRRFINKHL